MLSYIRKICFSLYLILFGIYCHSTVLMHKSDVLPLTQQEKPPLPEKNLKQSSTLFGTYFLSNKEEAICKNNIPAEVKLVTTTGDSLIHFFMGPFYNTKTVIVYCRPLRILDGNNFGQ
ncbi:LIC_10461 domain-containing protein [Leptospira saintgironsiae]|uniref:Uncharacterized protein n=1 Tax=Leptospira saintgironsiae TaxID=2023183 RepID=A0A2M9YHL7_9LEPT|nr:hypothetical protein [Leptospira saintgironsiae]PJZ51010.1 hypothetical protein CH362_04450 [Leptospira saintgironsiae]